MPTASQEVTAILFHDGGLRLSFGGGKLTPRVGRPYGAASVCILTREGADLSNCPQPKQKFATDGLALPQDWQFIVFPVFPYSLLKRVCRESKGQWMGEIKPHNQAP